MSVAFLDLGAATRELRGEIDESLAEVLASGWYIGGPAVTRFEEEWAAYCGAAYCVGVGNGLDALHLSLRALEIGSGDEVIVASNSYIATVLAITMAGATPVLVEPDPATHNLDPRRIEAALTPRTRALLPTHLYGQPADMDALLALAGSHGLRVIDDAAQAHGARYRGRRVGASADITAWSFYPSKNLGALGDAGAITTNDPEFAQRVRVLGNYGSSRRYINEVRGLNSRLDPMQAAILAVKLRHLDRWNDRRKAVAGYYNDRLSGAGLTLPYVPDWADPAWHLYVVQHSDRGGFQSRLAERGIGTLIHYPVPPHLQQAYADMNLARGSLPIAERLADTVLSLPVGPHMSDGEVEQVVQAVLASC
ncbi:MAG: Aminotransferase [uncultured Sphingomonas sp.]|uniref:Aminotransferase n=1 Tax=uncultured Sphingomonas sp. TaxID=158754 RepID=A0A6J4SKZ6_9SPHN|nr:DegT/DnrJ/EryC1/StrS family aminotransferase [uncultured Sphingomonas sp.]CAA9498830.1 MAG: Aminotransferase [uncultured Sphingomonas sp.]